MSRLAAYAAAVWSMVFLIPHVYWAAGGTAGPEAEPLGGTLAVVNYAAIALSAVAVALALSLARPWSGALPRRALRAGAWIASVVLTARGAGGLLQGLVAGGAWSEVGADALVIAFEALFLLGGILFGLAARAYSRCRAPTQTAQAKTAVLWLLTVSAKVPATVDRSTPFLLKQPTAPVTARSSFHLRPPAVDVQIHLHHHGALRSTTAQPCRSSPGRRPTGKFSVCRSAAPPRLLDRASHQPRSRAHDDGDLHPAVAVGSQRQQSGPTRRPVDARGPPPGASVKGRRRQEASAIGQTAK